MWIRPDPGAETTLKGRNHVPLFLLVRQPKLRVLLLTAAKARGEVDAHQGEGNVAVARCFLVVATPICRKRPWIIPLTLPQLNRV